MPLISKYAVEKKTENAQTLNIITPNIDLSYLGVSVFGGPTDVSTGKPQIASITENGELQIHGPLALSFADGLNPDGTKKYMYAQYGGETLSFSNRTAGDYVMDLVVENNSIVPYFYSTLHLVSNPVIPAFTSSNPVDGVSISNASTWLAFDGDTSTNAASFEVGTRMIFPYPVVISKYYFSTDDSRYELNLSRIIHNEDGTETEELLVVGPKTKETTVEFSPTLVSEIEFKTTTASLWVYGIQLYSAGLPMFLGEDNIQIWSLTGLPTKSLILGKVTVDDAGKVTAFTAYPEWVQTNPRLTVGKTSV